LIPKEGRVRSLKGGVVVAIGIGKEINVFFFFTVD